MLTDARIEESDCHLMGTRLLPWKRTAAGKVVIDDFSSMQMGGGEGSCFPYKMGTMIPIFMHLNTAR